jgi:hypothetical protein
MTRRARLDLDAGDVVALVRGLSSDELAIVSGEPTEDGAADAVATIARAELRLARRAAVPLPRSLKDGAEADAWRASVNLAAEQPNVPAIDEIAPQTIRGPSRTADDASVRLVSLASAHEDCVRGLKGIDDKRRLAGVDAVAAMKRHIAKLRVGEVAVSALEIAVLATVFATQAGIDLGNLAATSMGSLVSCAGFSIASFIASLAIARGVLGLRKSLDRKLRRIALGGLSIAAFATLMLAIGVLRWTASLPAEELTSWHQALEAGANFVLATLIGSAMSLIAAGLRKRIGKEAKELQSVAEQAAIFDEEEVRLEEECRAIDAEIGACEAVIAEPQHRREMFELGVLRLKDLLKNEEGLVAVRVARARAAHRALAPLSPAARQAVIADVAGRGDRDLFDRVKTNGAVIGVIVAAILASGPGQGCAPPKPVSTVFACDGTGARTEDVCNVDVLAGAFESWSRRAIGIHESAFLVLSSAGSFGEVDRVSIRVSERWNGSVRAARHAWIRGGVDQLRSFAIPADQPGSRKNQSDLVSLLVIAARERADLLNHEVHLILASDGWLISLGFNAERTVPRAEDVVEKLKTRGIAWDLSGFTSITLCGLHNEGATAERAALRDRLWTRLVEMGRGPTPIMLTTCRGLGDVQ